MSAPAPERVEWAEPGDRYADYCLWDYAPLAPAAGRLRQSTLLWQSFAAASAHPRLVAICDALRAGLGPFRTVWGVKRHGSAPAEALTWELYFYDYARLGREVSLGRVLDLIAPFAPSPLRDLPERPYFMVSLDLDGRLARGERGLDAATLYIGNPGSQVSSGIAYNYTRDGLRLDNLYCFFDARAERAAIEAKLACSAHLDLPGLDLDALLWPELSECGVVVVANKRLCEGLYFSRITVDQLLLFLDRLAYPEAITGYVRAHRRRLSHLLFDVGIDYTIVDGRVQVAKSAYYGLL